MAGSFRALAEKVRSGMWDFAEAAFLLADDGSGRPYEPTGTPDRAKTWWGAVLQWTWITLAFLVGIAFIALTILSLFA